MAVSLPINSMSPTITGTHSPPPEDNVIQVHPGTPEFTKHPITVTTEPRVDVSAQDRQLAAQSKRKPNRRANTAERRATHNAVERQRRETLNGRFLDLAGLLPNLSQIRRPSKSSIVNSSIAHIQAARRHRLLAAREFRIMKLESDALRRELNEWRDRAGLPRVEEPVRSDGFTMVMNGEMEVLSAIQDDEDDSGGQYDGFDDGEDDFPGAVSHPAMAIAETVPPPHSMMKTGHGYPQSNSHAMSQNISRSLMSANSGMPFDHQAGNGLYESHGPQGGHIAGPQYLSQSPYAVSPSDGDKVAPWNTQMMNAVSGSGNQQAMAHQRSIYQSGAAQSLVPTLSSKVGHGASFGNSNEHSFYANMQRQQQLAAVQHQANLALYGSSLDGDDTSSVGSLPLDRERSGSFSHGSGFASPIHSSASGNFDLAPSVSPAIPGEYGLPRRLNSGPLHVNTGGSWGDDGLSAIGMMKQNVASPISVGGGGNGTGFAMMMM